MAFNFITGLSESRLFPSRASLERKNTHKVAEMAYLYFVALRILLAEDETATFARQYCRRTIEWGTFDKWRNDASDMFAILHGLKGFEEGKEWNGYPINHGLVIEWFKDASHDRMKEPHTKRLFLRLDFDLKVQDESMRAVRRLVQDWPDLDKHKKELAITRLLQMFRARMPKSELLPFLDRVARLQDLELKDVQDLEENATAGATGAASIATSVGGIGAGFDPNGDWGIYQNKKKKKPVVLKR